MQFEKLQAPKEHVNFEFESSDQLEGLLGLKYWLKQKGSAEKVRDIDLFFIQKDHESHIYWQEFMAAQISDLQKQIFLLRKEISDLKKQNTTTEVHSNSRLRLLASKARKLLSK